MISTFFTQVLWWENQLEAIPFTCHDMAQAISCWPVTTQTMDPY